CKQCSHKENAMKPQVMVTTALLFFVGLCLVTLVMKEMQSQPAPILATAATTEMAPAATQALNDVPDAEEARFVAYFLHGNVRCQTCIDIETYSHEAITTVFADQLKSGKLEWRTVNYDTPENAHFRDDFQLAFQSVVLAEERDGKIVRW